MFVIIPLAGPDFISNGNIKGELQYKGKDLLIKILESRPWYGIIPSQNYIFIINNDKKVRDFANEKLNNWFPGCKIIILNHFTRGAAFSVLSAGSFVDLQSKIIIDLADIDYKITNDSINLINQLDKKDALAISFKSTKTIYSYLLFENNNFIEAREKKVISNLASAGTYIFGSFESYVEAFYNMANSETDYTFNNLYYICPIFNGIKSIGGIVRHFGATDIIDIKNF